MSSPDQHDNTLDFIQQGQPKLPGRPALESVIPDILRTHRCVPGSVFEVAQIDARIRVSQKHRTVRLLLSDDRLCIQALLSAAAHRLVDAGVIYEGCYVRLGHFKLRVLQSREAGPPTVFLVVEQISVVGRPDLLSRSGRSWSRHNPEPAHRRLDLEFAAQEGPPDSEDANRSNVPGGPFREADEDERIAGLAQATGADTKQRSLTTKSTEPPPTLSRVEDKSWCPLASTFHATEIKALPWISNDLTRQPLKLTVLRSIPHLPFKQNWTVNVLAVVAQLSDLEPSHLPPRTQRRARLVDPSTTKQILLTVFLDPEDFTPGVGSAVLLVGVKNHVFDGGSLKKYASDRPRDGNPWWYEDPEHLEWCEVAALKAWWAAGQTQEAEPGERSVLVDDGDKLREES